jgi:hypothetical protein
MSLYLNTLGTVGDLGTYVNACSFLYKLLLVVVYCRKKQGVESSSENGPVAILLSICSSPCFCHNYKIK